MNQPTPTLLRFLKGAVGAAAAAFAHMKRPFLFNPCLDPAMVNLQQNPLLERVWQGLDPAKVWDCHVHLAGIGDSDHGLYVGHKFQSLRHPVFYSQRLFYMNAACAANGPGTVDDNYAQRLRRIAINIPGGFKAMLLAFDWYHDDQGREIPELSTFYVPDSYARQLAEKYPEVFEWVASIHPYRPDAVDRLEAAAAQGARAIKWLPAAQNIDPASSRCDGFFAALARLKLPLIIHCGKEEAAQGENLLPLGNPLRLRRALDAGVRVVVAHCASTGDDEDFDKPGTRQTSFALFARLMERQEWKENLFGDISAIVFRNRKPEIIKTLLDRHDWHGRLLNGSDYPLPGILPLISLSRLVRHGLLAKEALADLRTLRQCNALYFDLALKRSLGWRGKTFSPQVFETRAFFGTA
ncbi:MAG: amidohydrolase [Azoarcus sp.]|jgi:mannonate dehydratase|nr:amidohydrolase [Azoarcus sp.]